MKKAIKEMIIFLTLGVFVFSGSACGKAKERSYQKEVKLSDEEIKQDILNHLKDKYGFEFESSDFEPINKGNALLVYKKGDSREHDSASAYREEIDGKVVYEDEYFSIIIREDFEKMVSKEVEKIFGENIVFSYLPLYYKEEYNSKTTFEEFYEKEDKIGFEISIYIIGDSTDKIDNIKLKKLIKILKTKKCDGLLTISMINRDIFAKLNRENKHGYITDEHSNINENVVFDRITTTALFLDKEGEDVK